MKRLRAKKGGEWIGSKFYKGGQFIPNSPKPTADGPTLDALSEAMIHRVEADDLPPDVGYSQAMRRVLVRRAKPTVKDLATLDRRRRAAVAMLADHPDSVVRRHFSGLLAAYPNV